MLRISLACLCCMAVALFSSQAVASDSSSDESTVAAWSVEASTTAVVCDSGVCRVVPRPPATKAVKAVTRWRDQPVRRKGPFYYIGPRIYVFRHRFNHS